MISIVMSAIALLPHRAVAHMAMKNFLVTLLVYLVLARLLFRYESKSQVRIKQHRVIGQRQRRCLMDRGFD